MRLHLAKWMHRCLCVMLSGLWLLGGAAAVCADSAPDSQEAIDDLLAGRFKWSVSAPLVHPLQRPGDLTYSIKDPSIIRYKGKWHLFCTIRGKKRSHQIEYLCFDDWKQVEKARRRLLKLREGYFCAPQVFYFTPHKRWYLIHQVIEESHEPALQPAYSTTDDIADANSWTESKLLFSAQPENVKRWIDFWVICDSGRAHLFFTSLDGQMWRCEATLTEFPSGWSRPHIVLRGDIFEASHTYRLKRLNKFLTVVEAQAGGRRYYKAYLASALDGAWLPLAASEDKPFASPANTMDIGVHWTDSFSHGELLRDGYDETLLVDPADLRFLFQGVSDEGKKGKPYGQIPWRLGILSR